METGPILRSMRRSKVRYGLLVLEVALTLAIVTNCVQMALKARDALGKQSGFDEAGLLWVRAVPFSEAFREEPYRDQVLARDLAALRALPGVRAVSNTRFRPWQGGGSSTELRAAGTRGEMLRTQIYPVDEAALDALGTGLVEGRMFTHDDVERETRLVRDLPGQRKRAEDGRVRSPIVQSVVVSKAYAALVFGRGPWVGRMLEDSDGDRYRIVGVMDPFYNPYGWPIHEYGVFYPVKVTSYDGGTPFLVRATKGNAAAVAASVEKTLLAVDPGRVVTVKPILELKDRNLGEEKLMLVVLTTVIGLLLFVTALGIVGVTSFTVAERTRQIGTRRALGATRLDIVRYFLVENGLVTTLGVVLGAALTVGLNVVLVQQAGATRLDGTLLVAGALLLWAAGFLATLVPALRGSRVAPAVATRNV